MVYKPHSFYGIMNMVKFCGNYVIPPHAYKLGTMSPGSTIEVRIQLMILECVPIEGFEAA